MKHIPAVADLPCLPGHSVYGVLLHIHLAEAVARDQEEDAQVADPGAPEPRTVFAGIKDLLS